METRIPGATENLWDPQRAQGLSELETLTYRSNLLGTDRAVANFGGGNTSTKARARDHTGREEAVSRVQGERDAVSIHNVAARLHCGAIVALGISCHSGLQISAAKPHAGCTRFPG